MPQQDVAAHAAAVAASTSAVAFRLTAAAAVSDGLGAGSHVFLLPSEGEVEVRRLHSQLYSGVLASKLRRDLPYQPHVTVGAFAQHADAERTAATLTPCDIPGQLVSIELAMFDGGTVAPLHDFPLR